MYFDHTTQVAVFVAFEEKVKYDPAAHTRVAAAKVVEAFEYPSTVDVATFVLST